MKLDGMINVFLVPICVSKCLDASNLRNHIIMACSLLQERQFGICIQLMIPQNSRCCCLHILCLFRQFRNILRKFFEARVLRMAVFPIMGIQMLEIKAILLSCLLSNTENYDFMHSSTTVIFQADFTQLAFQNLKVYFVCALEKQYTKFITQLVGVEMNLMVYLCVYGLNFVQRLPRHDNDEEQSRVSVWHFKHFRIPLS